MAKILSRGEHTTLRLVDDFTVTKTATGEGAEKLAKEIDFLELNKLELHFNFLPDILSYEVKKSYAHYSMPYLSGPLLRDYIYADMDLASYQRSLLKVIKNLTALHCEVGTINASKFSKDFYLNRLQGRWAKLRNKSEESLLKKSFSLESITSSDVGTVFSHIAEGTVLLIDGKEINFSFDDLINSLVSLEKVFDVPQTSIRLIHGDPHAGNILLHKDNAILLDPNGFMDGGDVAYDFGKLLVSFDWHDLSMIGMLKPVQIAVEHGRLIVTHNKEYTKDYIQKRHELLRRKIMELLIENVTPLYGNDPLLLQRIKLLLYIHQFSFAPTLIKERPQTALHILLNAISDYTKFIEEEKFSFF